MKINHSAIVIIIIGFLASFTSYANQYNDSDASVNRDDLYNYLSNIKKDNYTKNVLPEVKLADKKRIGLLSQSKSIEAESLGMQAGKYYATEVIRKHLEKKSESLNEITDISAYMQTYKSYLVMPAIITETDGRKKFTNSKKIAFRVSDKTYVIQSQPRFVNHPPSWRDYVQSYAARPTVGSKSLLPESAEEQKDWKINFQKGWEAGIKQAIYNTKLQLVRAVHDGMGVQRYHMYKDAGLVSEPLFREVENKVTGSKNIMNVGDRYIEISVMPSLQRNYKQWKAIPRLPTLEGLLPIEYIQLLNGVTE